MKLIASQHQAPGQTTAANLQQHVSRALAGQSGAKALTKPARRPGRVRARNVQVAIHFDEVEVDMPESQNNTLLNIAIGLLGLAVIGLGFMVLS